VALPRERMEEFSAMAAAGLLDGEIAEIIAPRGFECLHKLLQKRRRSRSGLPEDRTATECVGGLIFHSERPSGWISLSKKRHGAADCGGGADHGPGRRVPHCERNISRQDDCAQPGVTVADW
jgi:hypothetical protein